MSDDDELVLDDAEDPPKPLPKPTIRTERRSQPYPPSCSQEFVNDTNSVSVPFIPTNPISASILSGARSKHASSAANLFHRWSWNQTRETLLKLCV